MAEELIALASKQEMAAKSKQFWNPGQAQFWIGSGVPPVIDRREGYFLTTSLARPGRAGPAVPDSFPPGGQPDGEPGMDEGPTLVREVRPNELPVTKLVNLSADAAAASRRER